MTNCDASTWLTNEAEKLQRRLTSSMRSGEESLLDAVRLEGIRSSAPPSQVMRTWTCPSLYWTSRPGLFLHEELMSRQCCLPPFGSC